MYTKILIRKTEKNQSSENSWNHKSRVISQLEFASVVNKYDSRPITFPMNASPGLIDLFILSRFALDGFSHFRLFSDGRLVISN